jgi:glutamine synthetase adenylyltransferase
MRSKQRQGRTESALTAHMTDLQLIAELGILIHAHRYPTLLAHRQIPDQLQALGDCGALPNAQARTLIEGWQQLIALRHQHWLSGRTEAAQVPEDVAAAINGYWTSDA